MRAIDRHEDAIVRVLDLCDPEIGDQDYGAGLELDVAIAIVSSETGLTTERLGYLVRLWCALAGIEVPS